MTMKRISPLLAELDDLRDVVVLDRRRDARLVEEHLLEAHVAVELRDLDRDELLESTLAFEPREPHRSEAAVATGASSS